MTSSAPPAVCYGWAKTFSLHRRRGRSRPCLTAEPVVIDYETFCKIHDCHDRQGLTIAQTAGALGLHPKTDATWVARPRFGPRRSRPRGSVLDPFKPRITRWLDTHPAPRAFFRPDRRIPQPPRAGPVKAGRVFAATRK